eukprot:3023952-Rhodomonas_salina.2
MPSSPWFCTPSSHVPPAGSSGSAGQAFGHLPPQSTPSSLPSMIPLLQQVQLAPRSATPTEIVAAMDSILDAVADWCEREILNGAKHREGSFVLGGRGVAKIGCKHSQVLDVLLGQLHPCSEIRSS